MCDYCGSQVNGPEMLTGKLALRKRG
ncbi:MAG: hypothetical protein QOJ93_398, partial [Actinomycetota bacterium]|nr:hypothetical protein [Actinomycetota bacterium]